MNADRYPLILVGGGLANGLIAWRLRHALPDVHFLLIEQSDRLGGHHTWSLHGSDVTAGQRAWLDPLVTQVFRGYDVRFPTHRRTLNGDYLSLRSGDFHDRVAAACGDRVLLNQTVREVTADGVTLAGGTRLSADLVLDGRGATRS